MRRITQGLRDRAKLPPWLRLLLAISLLLLVAWRLTLAPGHSARDDSSTSQAQHSAADAKQMSVSPAGANTIAGMSKQPRALLEYSRNVNESTDKRVFRIGSAVPPFVAGAGTSSAAMKEKNEYEYRKITAALNQLMHAVDSGSEDRRYQPDALAETMQAREPSVSSIRSR